MWVSDELINLLIDHSILIEEEFESDETDLETRIAKWAEWQKTPNVSPKGPIDFGGQHYVINPLVPKFPASLRFEDVAIRQQKSDVLTRKDVDITSEFCRGYNLKVPIASANMSTVTNNDMCVTMRALGGLGVLHRAFLDTATYIKEARKQHYDDYGSMTTWTSVDAASIGVGYDQLELAKQLIKVGVKIIVIDIANGYSDEVKLLAKSIKRYSSKTKIVVGNVINPKAIEFYDDVADAVKVGVGQGFACETKNTAGTTEGQFTAVYRCAATAKKLGMPIISDGGVQEPADFVKAIAAGANTVMAGKIFAACPESAAEVIDGKKVYAGMASRYVQEKWRGGVHNDCPEGKKVLLDIGEPVAKLVERYAGALRSGISYVGASNIVEFHAKAKFVRVVNGLHQV